ncbi:MAG: cytidine deaminase [Clostridia bacterium]|nr:cytidine deaminase [Clostridia bacterium]
MGQKTDYSKLIEMAVKTKEKAYAPYSGFRVGAALVTENGSIYTGVNIENATYGATCCAERTAVYKAVSEGNTTVKAIAVASDSEELVYPCGICRQVLAEFGSDDMEIICTSINGSYRIYRLDELLPQAFRKIR